MWILRVNEPYGIRGAEGRERQRIRDTAEHRQLRSRKRVERGCLTGLGGTDEAKYVESHFTELLRGIVSKWASSNQAELASTFTDQLFRGPRKEVMV